MIEKESLTLGDKKAGILAFFLILLLAIIPFWATGCSGLIEKTDTEFPFHPADMLERYLYAWSPDYAFGYVQSLTETYKLPILGGWAVLQYMQVPLWLINRATFILPFLFMGLGMFFLASTSVKSTRAKFLSAAFFMYNPIVLRVLLNGQWLILLGLSSIAFALFFLIRGLDGNQGSLKYALGIGCASLFIRPINVLYGGILVLGMYVLFHLVVHRMRSLAHTAKFAGLSLVLSICFNLWFVLPFMNEVRTSGYQSAGFLTSPGYVQTVSSWLSLLSSARLAQLPNSPEYLYNFYATFLNSHLFLATSSLLLILATLTFLRKPNRFCLFFGIAFAAFLFMGKGSSAPYGQVYSWLFDHLPGFVALRSPLHFLELLTIPYAFLIGTSSDAVVSHLGKLFHVGERHSVSSFKIYGHKAFPVIALGLILLNSSPLLTGNLVGWLNPIELPSYYKESAEWLNQQPGEFRVLFPKVDWMVQYTWAAYDMPLVYRRLSSKSVVEEWDASRNFISQPFSSRVLSVPEWNSTEIGKVLGLAGVKYIVIQKDVEKNPFTVFDPRVETDLMQGLKGIHLERTFGNLDFYINEYWQPQHIYAASDAILTHGDIDNMIRVVERDDFLLGDSVLLLSSQNDVHQLLSISAKMVEFNPRNISSSVYDGRVNPVNLTLIASESYAARYHPGFKGVISTNGNGDADMLIFQSPVGSPYTFPSFSLEGWNAYNSTLVYFITDDKPKRLYSVLADEGVATDIVGIWWGTDWLGMNTKTITYPITIPPYQKCIIQINHRTDTMGLLVELEDFKIPPSTKKPTTTYEKINPTKYIVQVNSSEPFFLVFSESYHKDWVAYINGQKMPNQYHFMANGFANAWFVNKTGTFTIILEFWPQRLFHVGSAISVATIILCVLYISKNKLRMMYRRAKAKPAKANQKLNQPTSTQKNN